MMSDKDKDERPLAYPKPTETDQQLNQQDEYVDQKNNDQLSVDAPLHNEKQRNETQENSKNS